MSHGGSRISPLRRLGLAAQNALEIVRTGRLTSPEAAPFEIVHDGPHHTVRRYLSADGRPGVGPPVVLIPPLMVAAEIYDVAPDISAVSSLVAGGADAWVVDFGSPERVEGGMHRTLDDHVRAVDVAIDAIRSAVGRDVHLAGYSQGGMFAYQVAALRRSRGLSSLITFGSPVDVHRSVPNVADDIAERAAAGLRAMIALPLARIEGLPGRVTSTGFKLLSARKEIAQLVDFVRVLHDREALARRERRRLFLGGEGFVAYPGPALRKFVDDIVVANRMLSGGFVIDGRTVTLADIECPILYFTGTRDEIARPAAVRSIARAAPHAGSYEVSVRAGHFGLVVGSTALAVTWPTVLEWLRWREGVGGRPRGLRADARDEHRDEDRAGDGGDGGDDPGDGPGDDPGDDNDLALLYSVVRNAGRVLWSRAGAMARDIAGVSTRLRAQVPHLRRLRALRPGDPISASRELAHKARTSPEQTFFLWRDRAFSYADANRRVDNVVRGLIACGIRPGQRVGVLMSGRPSYLSLVTALNRLGAVAVLIDPATRADALPGVLERGGVTALVTDPDNAPRVGALPRPGGGQGRDLLVLGARVAAGARALPAGAVDMERIDPDAVALPDWYHPDPGRAGDLAMVIFGPGRAGEPRAALITNQRWAFAALGAAAACTLTARDTVYCCLPLHHAAGILVSAGGALVSGARLALSARFAPRTFWPEVRRYGATVVSYAGQMCRYLLDAPPSASDRLNPVRLFAGSGMRAHTWRELTCRFGVGVLEFYATTEGNAVLANASGEKIGALGRPLPGSAEFALARLAPDGADGAGGRGDAAGETAGNHGRLVRGPDDMLVRCRADEPGLLLARLDAAHPHRHTTHGEPARRIVRDAFAPGDAWFVTGDVVRQDADGDYWFIDRLADMVRTGAGTVATTAIEDALYEIRTVSLAVGYGVRDPAAPPDAPRDLPAATVVLAGHAGQAGSRPAGLSPADVEHACAALPAHARPVFVRTVTSVVTTDGHRPLKGPLRAAGVPAADERGVIRLDPATGRYRGD